MKIDDLITAKTIITNVRAVNKSDLLLELAAHAAPLVGLDHLVVSRALDHRESLGSTGLGMGVAMPHARFKALGNPFALFARLTRAVDFHALDGRQVDLVLLLLGPEPATNTYLNLLISTSRALRDSSVRDQLRAVTDAPSIVTVLRKGIEQNSGSGSPIAKRR